VYIVLLILAAVVCVFSLISSVYFVRKQQDKELDRTVDPASVAHPIAKNPVVIAYWLFPILVVLGAILLAIAVR
jgi:uncharacterized membrane protein